MEAEEEAPAAETTNSRPSSSRPQSAAKGEFQNIELSELIYISAIKVTKKTTR